MKEVVQAFGLSDVKDQRWFSRDTMKSTKTVEKMQEISKRLVEYYLPCKARNYLFIITDKVAITILRQILREFGYALFSKETYRNKKKQILYQVYSNTEIEMVQSGGSKSPIKKSKSVVSPLLRPTVVIDNNPDYVISFND